MVDKPRRSHRPRMQTPEQKAAERALRERFQRDKPSLQDLVASGDVTQVFTMGEYWELRKTFAALKALREQRGLSGDAAGRCGSRVSDRSPARARRVGGLRRTMPRTLGWRRG